MANVDQGCLKWGLSEPLNDDRGDIVESGPCCCCWLNRIVILWVLLLAGRGGPEGPLIIGFEYRVIEVGPRGDCYVTLCRRRRRRWTSLHCFGHGSGDMRIVRRGPYRMWSDLFCSVSVEFRVAILRFGWFWFLGLFLMTVVWNMNFIAFSGMRGWETLFKENEENKNSL